MVKRQGVRKGPEEEANARICAHAYLESPTPVGRYHANISLTSESLFLCQLSLRENLKIVSIESEVSELLTAQIYISTNARGMLSLYH